jgi:hypothetical protein
MLLYFFFKTDLVLLYFKDLSLIVLWICKMLFIQLFSYES